MRIYIFFLMVLFTVACTKDKEIIKDGKTIFAEPNWKIALHERGQYHSFESITANLIYEDKAIITRTENNGKNILSSVDLNTGHILWNWDDVYLENEQMGIRDFFVVNNIFHYSRGTRHYRIDIDKGVSINNFQSNRANCGVYYTNIGSTSYYSCNDKNDPVQFNLKIYSLNHSDTELKLLDLSELYNLANVSIKITTNDKSEAFSYNSTNYLIVAYATADKNNFLQSYLALYDLTNDSLIYKEKEVNDEAGWFGGIMEHIRIIDDRIYTISNRKAVCLDLWTGEKIWQRNFPKWFFSSGFEVSDGIFVANCEDLGLYGLDIETGEILWETEGAGASSPLKNRILNGIVYFSGGSTDKIHAVDIHTGETKWRLDPAEYDNAEDFKRDIYVWENPSGGKGKVLIFTGMNVYCLDAVQ